MTNEKIREMMFELRLAILTLISGGLIILFLSMRYSEPPLSIFLIFISSLATSLGIFFDVHRIHLKNYHYEEWLRKLRRK